jgi:hypothetical protein
VEGVTLLIAICHLCRNFHTSDLLGYSRSLEAFGSRVVSRQGKDINLR